MKLRFSALDVAAECQELKRLQGYRLQNIYDINPKTYLLKFSQKEDKELVLVESGIRIHYTEFTRDKSNMPNGFCIKLRKHLRTKRLYSVKQVGFDRVVDFQFGQDEYAFHLIMEFYASGNIILTDHDYKILTLLRVFDDTSQDTKTAVGQIYSFNVRSVEPMNSERLLYALGQDLKGKKKKDSLLKALLKQEFVAYYGSTLLDYAIRDFQNIDPEQIIANSDLLESILGSFQRVDEIINSCCTNPQKGVIQTDDGAKTYLDFLPFNLDFSGETYKEFESFGKCVDEYFSKLEAQKLQAKALQAENLANKKYESAKAAHENQIKGFELAEHTKMLYARAIEHNIEFVDSVLQSVRALLATGIDWEDLKQLVREEQAEGNMIAIV
jgi:predicted ribosome quality control (RQC) complex YloA/Tae2 family protein